MVTRIAYSTEESISISPEAKTISLFEVSRKKSRQPLSVREIEYELAQIINEITDNPFLNTRFVFIFDELDKVNLSAFQTNCDQPDFKNQEPQFPVFSYDELSAESGLSKRKKQKCLISMLSQMKFFTSSTKAKFLFIAGHELYDAYLADISDREFAVSNLFTGIMNVPSFLSSKPDEKCVTKMTEAFICTALFDNEAVKNIKNNGVIEERYKLENITECYFGNKYNNFEYYAEKEYLISVLLAFTTYLTYISNGAPKKIAGEFEKYVYSSEQHEVLFRKQNIEDSILEVEGRRKRPDYYLSFGYKELEKIGFVSYMTRPIFSNIINNDSDHNDKLLVSSLFVISHIFKHYHNGFSWRDLEYIPEFIESSHIPELRKYVKSIFDGMETMSFANMTSGIFSYKFSRSLSEEISYFSKKYEDVSAIFNYSTDYFLSIKNYFYSMLSSYQKTQASSAILGSIHYSIGDILLAEEDFNQAINEYRFSAELHKKALNESQPSQRPKHIGRYAHAMLKLGLSYEKRGNYDSAYLIYNTLTDELIQFRDVNLKKELTDMKSWFIYDEVNRRDKGTYYLYKPEKEANTDETDNILIPELHKEKETEGHKIWAYGDELADNLSSYLSPEKKNIISRLAVFEGLRIVYLPILAKLFSIEKHNVRGITPSDINLAISEFDFLYKMTDVKSKYLLEVDFYRKLGDIMYYKNKNFFAANTWNDLFETFNIDIRHLITSVMFKRKQNKIEIEKALALLEREISNDDRQYITGSNSLYLFIKIRKVFPSVLQEEIIDSLKTKIGNWNKDEDKLVKCMFVCRDRRAENPSKIPLPCTACCYFTRSLNVLVNQISCEPLKYKSNILHFLEIISDPENLTFHKNELLHAALLMTSMGDVMLSCSSDSSFSTDFVRTCIEHLYDNKKIDKTDDSELNNTSRAILYQLAAMRCYERLGEYKHACDSMIRVLKIITLCFKKDKEKVSVELAVLLEKYINLLIKEIYSARGIASIPEISRFKNIALNGEKDMNGEAVNDNKFKKHILFGMSSIMPEVEEMAIAYYELLLETNEPSIGLISFLFKSVPLNNNHLSYLSCNRIEELHLKEKVNRIIFENLNIKEKKNDQLKSLSIDKSKDEEFKKSLIKDSIFALSAIIDILKTLQGTRYTNLYISIIYESLRFWENELDIICGGDWNKKDSLLDSENKHRINKHFINDNKERYFRQAVWMHTEGKEYHKTIKSLFILDDDLHNNTAHFYLAYERFKLRLMDKGDISTLVKPEEEDNKPHSYYKQSSFLSHHRKGEMRIGDRIPNLQIQNLTEEDCNDKQHVVDLFGTQPFKVTAISQNTCILYKQDNKYYYHITDNDNSNLFNICKTYHFNEFGYLYKIVEAVHNNNENN